MGPLLALLKQGVTPDKLAICLALGAGIGTFPILGTTTAICAVVALALRFNLVAIQIANYAVYPLQIILFIPFLRLGERLAGAPSFPLSMSEIVDRFKGGLWQALSTLSTSLMHAALGWLVVAPVAIVVLWLVLRPVMRRFAFTRAEPSARSS